MALSFTKKGSDTSLTPLGLYQLFSSLFLGFLYGSWTGIFLLWYLPRQVEGTSLKPFAKSRRLTEESHLLLFACPITRQTMVAAKWTALLVYWMGINLVGLICPTLLFFILRSAFGLLPLFSFFFLGLLLTFTSFFWLVLPLLYTVVVSGKKFWLTFLYLIGAIVAHNSVYYYLPVWGSLFLFGASFPVGIYFTWLYWKNFQFQDLC